MPGVRSAQGWRIQFDKSERHTSERFSLRVGRMQPVDGEGGSDSLGVSACRIIVITCSAVTAGLLVVALVRDDGGGGWRGGRVCGCWQRKKERGEGREGVRTFSKALKALRDCGVTRAFPPNSE